MVQVSASFVFRKKFHVTSTKSCIPVMTSRHTCIPDIPGSPSSRGPANKVGTRAPPPPHQGQWGPVPPPPCGIPENHRPGRSRGYPKSGQRAPYFTSYVDELQTVQYLSLLGQQARELWAHIVKRTVNTPPPLPTPQPEGQSVPLSGLSCQTCNVCTMH